jgi:uncharacterized membrane protein
MDIDKVLMDSERIFLNRAAKRKTLFLFSSIATVVVALSYLTYHGLLVKDMNGLRFVIILLLLLSGRSYLRLYKCAVIFDKLIPGAEIKE